MPGALDGLLVVSVEQAVAAPYCSARLADAGARVIKIERPEGDFARGYDGYVHGLSTYFVWLNRGKQSVTLDFKKAEDSALLQRLIGKADVLIQNLAPGAAERAGFGSARKLTAQFYFSDMSVLKVMFTAIVVAAVGLVGLQALGLADEQAMFVPPALLAAAALPPALRTMSRHSTTRPPRVTTSSTTSTVPARPGVALGDAGETRVVLKPGVFAPSQNLEAAYGGRQRVFLPQAVAERGEDYEIARFRELIRES